MDAASPSAVLSADDARRILSERAGSIPTDDVETYMHGIHAALADGEVDDAFRHFQEWLTREARYAHHGHESNMCELFETMLELIGWMYERVPRSMARTAARAA